MPSPFDRDHLRVDRFAKTKRYRRPPQGGGHKDYGRETEQHAEALKRELAEAWADADGLLSARDDAPAGKPGTYVDFETLPDAPLPDLNWKSKGIRLASAQRLEGGAASGTVFVPDEARAFLAQKLEEYQEVRGKRGNPAHEGRFAALEHFRAARLASLWVDRRPLPNEGVVIWWECWCWPDRVQNFVAKVEAAELLIGEGRLHFPEREVIFVQSDRGAMARLVASSDAVAELRLGRDDASFFTSEKGRQDQHGWVATAVDRIVPGDNRHAVALCLLDTGVNRAHPLLARLFAADDLHTVDPAWGTDDHHGHGSEMSGLSAYGDLITILPGVGDIPISFSGESVKLLPPAGFPPNVPTSYGLITQQAIFRAEIAKPDRERVFCMAVTQPDVYGPKATSWSASLDVAAFGGNDLTDLKQRLICVAAGNLPDGLPEDELENWDTYEIEDPAHAWNALSVGGYTQKGPITDAGYEHWRCAADAGSLSPYSRVSAAWYRGVSPIKPELVMEGGNKGVDAGDNSLVSGIDSLSLLTTSRDPVLRPLTLAWATSAATAQLAGMAANVLADQPELWPETIRALLVHSARWTPLMEASLLGTHQKSERLRMLRRFGYGVPSLERALRSRSSTIALVTEQTIQPYLREGNAAARLNEAHFFALPWPREALLELGAHDVRLRVTLSYFVEPNPSADAPLSPARYRSAGLRFDLRRRDETQAQFENRVNALAALDNDEDAIPAGGDPARLMGERSISAGSLHVEEWRCSAADLADRNAIAVFPVGGWWKTSRDQDRNNGEVRYALVVTIDAGDVEQDLWAEAVIAAEVPVEAAVEV